MLAALAFLAQQIGPVIPLPEGPPVPPRTTNPDPYSKLSGERFGQRVLAFGDVDGDKIPDFAVSDFARDDRENGPGRVWIFSGKERTLLQCLEGEKQTGKASARFGYALAAPGDMDGDGVSDLLVTACGSRASTQEADIQRSGYARLYSGRTWKVLRSFHAEGGMDGYGVSLAVLGDMDADGVPEFAVGADGSEYQRAPDTSDYPPCYVRVYSGKTGTLLRVFEGASQHGRFGHSLCGLPDIDGDSVPDLAVGEPGAKSGDTPGSGCVHILSGASGAELGLLKGRSSGMFNGRVYFGWSLASLKDVDADGVADFAAGCADCYVRIYSGKDRSVLGDVNSPVRGMFASGFADSLSSLEDVDGDGVCDLAVGAEKTSFAGEHYDVFIVSGKSRSVLLTRDTGEWYARVGRGGDLAGTGVPYFLVGLWQRDRVELVPIGKDSPTFVVQRPVKNSK